MWRKNDPIPGDYQYRALHEGFAPQRFWHEAKGLAIAALAPPPADGLAVDLGCGSGVVTNLLAEAGCDVLGVDASAEAIAFAEATWGGARVRFQQSDAAAFDLGGRKARAFYCLECIEHISPEKATAMLQRCVANLEPGGRVFLTTPNYRSAWPAIEYVLDRTRLVPPLDGAQHITRYTPAALRRLAEDADCEVETLRTMCLAAPWLNLISHGAAVRVHRWEIRRFRSWGPILAAVLRPRG